MHARSRLPRRGARRGTGERGRQRTRNYRRGYIPALSLPSRAVVTSRLHSLAARAHGYEL